MSNGRNCKFFARGTCYKGTQCEYVHAGKDLSVDQQICSFYQKGHCTYGSRCRYKHVKASQEQSSASSSSNRCKFQALDSPAAHTTKGTSSQVPKVAAKLFPSDKPARSLECKHQNSLRNSDVGESSTSTPSKNFFCTFPAANCPLGKKCIRIHGDQCMYCKKYCLHPTLQKEKENHLKTCEKKEKYLQALKDSQEIECNVCLERVLSKPTPAERKFGLLPECNHAFCLSCIQNWRKSTTTTGVDVRKRVKACPVCRRLSRYVIPSTIWISTQEEKQEIDDNYKAKCKLIDCKYFDFGNGNCPFGSRCFYKHTVKPGSYTWIHHKPPPGRPHKRNNNMDIYDTLDTLSDLDLPSGEFYSILQNLQFSDDLEPFQMMALSEMLASSGSGPYFDSIDSDDEDMNFFQMSALSQAIESGFDDFDPEELDNEEFNPVDAAFLSMMMQSSIEEEESSNENYSM